MGGHLHVYGVSVVVFTETMSSGAGVGGVPLFSLLAQVIRKLSIVLSW